MSLEVSSCPSTSSLAYFSQIPSYSLLHRWFTFCKKKNWNWRRRTKIFEVGKVSRFAFNFNSNEKKRRKISSAAQEKERKVLIWVIWEETKEKSFFLNFFSFLLPHYMFVTLFKPLTVLFFSFHASPSATFRSTSQVKWENGFFKLVHAKNDKVPGKVLQNDVKNWVKSQKSDDCAEICHTFDCVSTP